MTHIESGIQGAKRARWREVNPWKLLRQVAEGVPNAEKEELWSAFWEEAQGSDYIEAIARYFFDNAFVSLMKGQDDESPGKRPKGGKGKPSSEGLEAEVETRAILLLNLTTPNGKILGDCTKTDCKRLGGWYRELAKLVPVGKTVGQSLTEAKVRRLWNAMR